MWIDVFITMIDVPASAYNGSCERMFATNERLSLAGVDVSKRGT